ncbi:DUF86 domain-containing protein [Lujinxingia sediminis]|uniref:DUF86 domain-containing protein n=1 Tax=Lujinxingia sediminis TaxID=2480984 RepID=A0ABY0CMK9_9DELT|nr:DUF86 domain-containing protein [Lujinxingia sediminis]RVU40409.1 DUF86 domain-containing protein [Lujinxingia sediminis]
MSKDHRLYIRHIREEAEYLLHTCTALSYDAFLHDETLKRAVVRSLEIIGEATKKLPRDFRYKHDTIPWAQMAGMRDVLIHDYFGVDYAIVWDVVENRIPELLRELESIDDVR